MFKTVKDLIKDKNTAIVYITHRLQKLRSLHLANASATDGVIVAIS